LMQISKQKKKPPSEDESLNIVVILMSIAHF